MWLQICAEGPGIWLRLWAFGLYVRESIANAGMHHSFGIVQLSGEPGEKRKHCKASVRGLEARRWEKCLFSFQLAEECSWGRRDSHGVVSRLMNGCLYD